MRLKVHWGLGIAVVYGLFVVSLLAFWAFASLQKVDLVAPDYYAKETKYQQQIDRLKRTKALNRQVQVRLDGSFLIVEMPEHNGIEGSVLLYRPSNSAMDKEYPLLTDAHGRLELSLVGYTVGVWRVYVQWSSGGKEFFHEEVIYING